MNSVIMEGQLLRFETGQRNTKVTIEIEGPVNAKYYFGEFTWEVPGSVMDVNDVCDIPVGKQLRIEGLARVSQGKDKGDGNPRFVFTNLVAQKIIRLDGSQPQEDTSDWGSTEDNVASSFGDVPSDLPW